MAENLKRKYAPHLSFEQKSNLFLSGGGYHALIFLGILDRLESLLSFKHLSGVSAGGVLALMITCGYTPKQIMKEILQRPLISFLDTQIIFANQELTLVDSVALRKWAARLLRHSPIEGISHTTTFEQLQRLTKRDLKLFVLSASEKRICVLSAKTSPQLLVLDAILACVALPGVVSPQTLGRCHVFCDAAVVNNTPLHLCGPAYKLVALISNTGTAQTSLPLLPVLRGWLAQRAAVLRAKRQGTVVVEVPAGILKEMLFMTPKQMKARFRHGQLFARRWQGRYRFLGVCCCLLAWAIAATITLSMTKDAKVPSPIGKIFPTRAELCSRA